jgi:wobble nucleotide-excising tRNase
LYVKFDSYEDGNQIYNYNQLKDDIDSIKEEIAKKDKEKREKIATLKNESRYINNYLKRLGVCNFTVDINKNNFNENILINYQSGCTKNNIKHSLSEGEKTALAFAYFISKIDYEIFDNNQADIRDTIIVIDDPISSLDESRLYSTACLINNIFNNAKQLFIFSHNLIFLKFIGNLIGYPREENHKKEKVCCRRDYFLSIVGRLELLPYSLSNYQTVYFQKFYDILKYKKGIVAYDHAKIYIPNHIRVILETFLSFKFFLLEKGSGQGKYLSPGLDKLIKQLQNKNNLFKDYQEYNNINKNNFLQKLEQIRRITDPQSHGTPQNINEFNFISEAELKSLVDDALDVICFIDRIHYDEINNRIDS